MEACQEIEKKTGWNPFPPSGNDPMRASLNGNAA